MRGIIRDDISERDCADRLDALAASELALYNAHRSKTLSAADKSKLDLVGYYTLTSGENGGGNPHAPGPWSIIPVKGGRSKKRSDCIGCYMWARGLDRYQPVNFGHIYGGYINTDSMLMDALGEFAVTGRGSKVAPQKMFRPTTVLRRGLAIVYPSLFVRGRKVPGSWGHIMGLTEIAPSIVEAPVVDGRVDLLSIARGLTVVHCHGGLTGRTVRAIDRTTLHLAIGRTAGRAHLIEMVS